MECFGKPIWNNEDAGKALSGLKIDAPDENVRKKVLRNWDAIAKPIDGMGHFETLTAQIGAISRTDKIDLSQKALLILCADNGIVEEGISQSGQEVTCAVVRSMSERRSPVCRMAEAVGAEVILADVGMNSKEEIKGVLNRKIRCGTGNFRKEPAMTEKEAVRAVMEGIGLVEMCRDKKVNIIAAGEMGIGNTTTSSAVAAALLGCGAEAVTGRGAGLSDAGLLRKRQVISEALFRYDLSHADALTVLRTVGGLDIAGLAGVCMGGALYHIPVVLDGFITMTAALLAERLLPGTKAYLLPSHRGKEPAVRLLEKELGLVPVIDADMALGEGTGAVMMLSLLDLALRVYHTGTSFLDIRIEKYERLEERC